MVRRVILSAVVAAGLAASGCAGSASGLRPDQAVGASGQGGGSAGDAVNAHPSNDFENTEAASVYTMGLAGVHTSDSQDPIPIVPAPVTLQRGDGTGHYRLGGTNPVASSPRH